MARVKKANPNPVGAPKKAIDWRFVDQMLIEGASGTQVAACLGINPDTLYKRCEDENNVNFSAYSQEKRSIGDRAIHAKQYEKAIQEGNPTLLIWLGKQRLGQSETLESNQVDKEAVSKFNALIDQISSLRSLRKSSETSN